MEELQKDLEALAELVYEISEKHGGMYLSVNRARGFNLARATCDPIGDGDYIEACYLDKGDK